MARLGSSGGAVDGGRYKAHTNDRPVCLGFPFNAAAVGAGAIAAVTIPMIATVAEVSPTRTSIKSPPSA